MLNYKKINEAYKIFIWIICTFSFQEGPAQNLVPNGDFENFTTCPALFSEVNTTGNFWFTPTRGTSDYYNQCSSLG